MAVAVKDVPDPRGPCSIKCPNRKELEKPWQRRKAISQYAMHSSINDWKHLEQNFKGKGIPNISHSLKSCINQATDFRSPPSPNRCQSSPKSSWLSESSVQKTKMTFKVQGESTERFPVYIFLNMAFFQRKQKTFVLQI